MIHGIKIGSLMMNLIVGLGFSSPPLKPRSAKKLILSGTGCAELLAGGIICFILDPYAANSVTFAVMQERLM